MTTATEHVNQPVARLADLVAQHAGQARWFEKIVLDGRNRAGLISSPPGTPPDPHLHPDFNEWWVVLGGEVRWQIGEYEPIVARFGDIVIAPCGYRHDIQPVGTEQGMRLVVGLPTSNHELKGVEPARLVPVDVGLAPPNLIHTRLDWMLDRYGRHRNWGQLVIFDQRNRANMIHSLPGQASRAHWHPDMDEWWVVLKGELEWRVGNDEPFRAKAGDIVFVEAGRAHQITNVGGETSIRLAVTTPDVVHHFLDDPNAPRPPKE